jgi:signal transduction histidine kinase
MRERAAALGGALEIDSSAEGGTRLTAELPLPSAPTLAKMGGA